MENSLTKVRDSKFGTIICDYYSNGAGEFFMTRQQIGQALGYSDPQKAIDNIHRSHKDRMRPFSVTLKSRGTDGKMYDTCFYSAKGVYEICRWSRQPKADEFYDHVYDILEGLRLGYLKLSYEQQTVAWQTARLEGKKARRLETDAIKAFVDYAAANGSKHADRYYMLFTSMAYRALGIEKGKRNVLPASVLLNLRTVEQVIDRAIWEELAAGAEYHQAFQNVKSKVEQLTTLVFAPLPALTRLTKPELAEESA